MSQTEHKTFNPLKIIGTFWVIFGVIILASAFFIQETDLVPFKRGLITNLIASLLLIGTGILCVYKGRNK